MALFSTQATFIALNQSIPIPIPRPIFFANGLFVPTHSPIPPLHFHDSMCWTAWPIAPNQPQLLGSIPSFHSHLPIPITIANLTSILSPHSSLTCAGGHFCVHFFQFHIPLPQFHILPSPFLLQFCPVFCAAFSGGDGPAHDPDLQLLWGRDLIVLCCLLDGWG